MFTLREFYQPDSIKEAYEILSKSKRNMVLGGCIFLKMSNKKMGTGIDLSNLHLDNIKINDRVISIGASVTLSQLEENGFIGNYANGLIKKSIETIASKQLRNMATVGASVYANYGFSDIVPVFLALNARIHLYNAGWMKLSDFIKMEKTVKNRDILIEIEIPIEESFACYSSLRTTAGDFCILNLVVSRIKDDFNIVVGARPKKATIAIKTSEFISEKFDILPFDNLVKEAGDLLVEEVECGSNIRGSKEYREQLSKGLLRKALQEVFDESISYD
ncbi:FAD binding domain-containing protein [Miniphocaeibacter massiliensis]|uniref:FAD binding domain-containing protein n=1 Tax=Miniphocaeibacter massiliensis TaxID=2041841 RepID=UPI000C1BA0AF|nr:FAD binding domain-containing protein [Miniphocaeibacter massiliensis]